MTVLLYALLLLIAGHPPTLNPKLLLLQAPCHPGHQASAREKGHFLRGALVCEAEAG